MLHRAYLDITLCQYRTTGGLNNVLCHSIDNRCILQVNTLDLITGILWSRVKSDGDTQSGM